MKQSRIFGGFVIVIALTLVGYIAFAKIGWQNLFGGSGDMQADAGQDREILTYVPADTLFFFGGLEPMPFKHATDMMGAGSGWLQHADWSKQLTDEEKAAMPPAAKMITGLFSEYMQTMKQSDSAAAKLGVGQQIDSVAYSVGVIPVMRTKLADAVAFTAFLDRAEKKVGVKAEQQKAGNINLRYYSFDKPDAEEPSDVDLLIATGDQFAVFSIASKVEGEKARQVILGNAKPEQSLANLTTLQDIRNKYNFHPTYVSYVNHKEIMKGLTSEGGNEFGRMLDTIIDMAAATATKASAQSEGDMAGEMTEPPAMATAKPENPLAAIRTDACRKELMAMVESWPQTVIGYTNLDMDSKPKVMEARMVIENTDPAFMQEMQKIRGFIPAVLQDVKQNPVMGFGLGINIDALSPFIAKAIQEFTAKDYQCESLAQVKQSLLQSNPAMALGMMSGMVAGVQGVSAIIMDINGTMDFAQPGIPPDVKSLDAIITISSSNPQQLLMMAANMQPGMPPLQLPPDGTPIDFPAPLPLPNGAQLKLALKGNHIVAYVGEQSAQLADQLAQDKLQPNGMFAFNMDFGKYMKLITTAAQASANTDDASQVAMTDQDKAMLDAMSKINMQLVESFDIGKEGIDFGVKMTMDE
jgi:hypothetical protein